MSAASFWILDAVATDKWPLDYLKENVVEQAFNREGHGLTDHELFQLLCQLFTEGFLFADRVFDFQTWANELLIPGITELQRIFSGQDWVWYGLTEKGSAFWETVTQPNWQNYIFSGLAADGQCCVASGGRQILQSYLFKPDVQCCVAPGTLHIETVADWKATYWKTLPTGYTACFVVPTDKVEDFPFAESADDWYTNPCEDSSS